MPKKLPDDVVKHWPEVFGDIDVNVIPIEYLASIQIKFQDATNWEIDLTTSKQEPDSDSIEQMMSDLFDEYGNEIKSIDFKLDTDRVKRDITKRTNRFLKKRK